MSWGPGAGARAGGAVGSGLGGRRLTFERDCDCVAFLRGVGGYIDGGDLELEEEEGVGGGGGMRCCGLAVFLVTMFDNCNHKLFAHSVSAAAAGYQIGGTAAVGEGDRGGGDNGNDADKNKGRLHIDDALVNICHKITKCI
jgi:hypothetical protein